MRRAFAHLTRLASLVLAVIMLAITAPSVRAQAPDIDDAVLFDIHLGELRLGNGARGYAISGGYCVNFEDVASALDVAVTIDASNRRAEGWAFDEHNLLVIDRDRNVVRYAGRSAAIAPATIISADGGWCVDTGALGTWLGVTLLPDLLNAVLLVRSEKLLPVQQAQHRRTQAERVNSASALVSLPDQARIDIPYRLWRTPSADITAGVATDRGRKSASYEIFAAGEAAWMSAETRLASDLRGAPNEWRTRFYRRDPDARLLGPLKATNVALGDINSMATSLATISKSGRGLSLSNRPLDQDSRFDVITLRGDLPNGWEVELYRNGELLAVSGRDSSGRYLFQDVPLLYGSNHLEIVRYGPQGQVRRERTLYEVAGNAVPAGRLWWWAGGLQDDRDLVGLTPHRGADAGHMRYGGGLEYGVDLRTSVAANLQTFALYRRRKTLFQSEVRRALGRFAVSMVGAVDRRGAKAVRASTLGSIGGFRLSAEALLNRGLHSEDVDGLTRRVLKGAVDSSFKISSVILPIHFDLAELRATSGLKTRTWGGRLSYSARNISLTASVSAAQSASAGSKYGPPDTNVSMWASSRLGHMTIRGTADYHVGSGLQNTRVSGEWALDEQRQIAAEAGYDWQDQRTFWRGAYSHHFDKFALSVNASMTGKHTVAGRAEVLFSLGRRSDGRFGHLSSNRQATGGSLAVSIYRDDNANGVRDPGEQELPGVGLHVERQRVAAASPDAVGPVLVRSMAPDRPVSVGIDPGSLVDPMLDPGVREVRVVPRQGLGFAVQLAVVPTGMIEGRLSFADGTPAPRITIHLVDEKGREAASVQSDFDGSFLFEKVHYGQYSLRTDRPGFVLVSDSIPAKIVLNDQSRDVRLSAIKIERNDALFAVFRAPDAADR